MQNVLAMAQVRLLRGACLFALAISSASRVAYSVESAEGLVDSACRYRESIHTLHLRALDTSPEALEGSQTGYSRLNIEIWNDFVSDVHRCDSLFLATDGISEVRNVLCWQCEFKHLFLNYWDAQGGKAPIAVFGRDGNPATIPKMQLFGMVPTGLKELGSQGLTESPWLDRLRRGRIEPIPDDLRTVLSELEIHHDGNDSLRLVVVSANVKFQNGENGTPQDASTTGKAVFDIGRGGSIIYVENRISTVGFELVESTKSFLKEWDGFWYPQRIVSERVLNEERAHTEDVTVSDVLFNSKDTYGTLLAIKVASGALVIGAPGHDGPTKWDGANLVRSDIMPLYSQEGIPLRESTVPQVRRNLPVLLLINGLVIVGLVVVILVRRSK